MCFKCDCLCLYQALCLCLYQALKQQLNVLQEDLRKRESRWSNTQSRLRQQVDALSAENASLRDQVRTLEKLRLSVWKSAEKEKGRFSTSSNTTSTGSKRTDSKERVEVASLKDFCTHLFKYTLLIFHLDCLCSSELYLFDQKYRKK